MSNGPTLAFKDIALQLLGNLFEYVLARATGSINILGATSGDTGSSAEYAMRGKRGIAVFMLSPKGRMSPFQQAQMFSLADPNIFNLAIEGTFDDCQDLVKAVANDAAFKARWKIGAVNSINWARIAAQVVYYFKGYFAATDGQRASSVDFAVPSGNFGNILAAHVAREMGLPIRRLILATNENDVLDEFFRTGRYRPRSARETHATSSPSMDISKASNFERFIFDVDRAESRGVCANCGRRWPPTGGFDLSRHALVGATCRRPASCPDAARMPTASRRFARSPRATASSSIRTRPTASRSASNYRDPARPAHLRRNGAAGQIRGDDPRGARPRPGAPGRLARPRGPAAAQHDAAPPIRSA